MFRPSDSALKIQPESKLNQPGIVQLLIDHAETGRSVYVLLSCVADATHIELRVIEQIEKLGPKLQLHGLAPRQREVFDDGKIRVHETRAVNRSAGSDTEFSRRRVGESTGVEHCARQAVWPVGIAHDVGAVEAKKVVIEILPCVPGCRVLTECWAGIGAVDDEERESRLGSLHQIDLPVPQNGVGSSSPVAAVVLPLAEWKIIEDAGGESIVQVQLRQSPIQFLGAGQRPIDRADIGAQAIG